MKQKIVKTLLVAATLPALLIGTSTSAFADGQVWWVNNKTGKDLMYDSYGNVWGGRYDPEVRNHDWYETLNSDGTWNIGNGFGHCLTAYERSVYTERCNAAANQTNAWQRWKEIKTPTGWKLKNLQSGWILDDDGYGHIYANSNDVGDSDLNQRWH